MNRFKLQDNVNFELVHEGELILWFNEIYVANNSLDFDFLIPNSLFLKGW